MSKESIFPKYDRPTILQFEAEINRQVILVRTTEAILEIHDLETINLSQHPGQELQDLVYSSLAFH
jgi:hypothetical protein